MEELLTLIANDLFLRVAAGLGSVNTVIIILLIRKLDRTEKELEECISKRDT